MTVGTASVCRGEIKGFYTAVDKKKKGFLWQMQLSFSDMKIKKNVVYKLHSKRKRSDLLNGALL